MLSWALHYLLRFASEVCQWSLPVEFASGVCQWSLPVEFASGGLPVMGSEALEDVPGGGYMPSAWPASWPANGAHCSLAFA
ncbi:MAG: hypothetical protein HC800_10575 [Phormidesmis sp. RL_2_1]|nr:hypothetical protein [Phormidesmis sp. RL_2_1]